MIEKILRKFKYVKLLEKETQLLEEGNQFADKMIDEQIMKTKQAEKDKKLYADIIASIVQEGTLIYMTNSGKRFIVFKKEKQEKYKDFDINIRERAPMTHLEIYASKGEANEEKS